MAIAGLENPDSILFGGLHPDLKSIPKSRILLRIGLHHASDFCNSIWICNPMLVQQIPTYRLSCLLLRRHSPFRHPRWHKRVDTTLSSLAHKSKGFATHTRVLAVMIQADDTGFNSRRRKPFCHPRRHRSGVGTTPSRLVRPPRVLSRLRAGLQEVSGVLQQLVHYSWEVLP